MEHDGGECEKNVYMYVWLGHFSVQLENWQNTVNQL